VQSPTINYRLGLESKIVAGILILIPALPFLEIGRMTRQPVGIYKKKGGFPKGPLVSNEFNLRVRHREDKLEMRCTVSPGGEDPQGSN
jgi:hypothetical protein